MSSRNNPESAWLMDAAVQSIVTKHKGRWEVSLRFVNPNNPRQFLIHKIADYRTKNLAEIAARYMSQTAAKDIRGTIKMDPNDFNTNTN